MVPPGEKEGKGQIFYWLGEEGEEEEGEDGDGEEEDGLMRTVR